MKCLVLWRFGFQDMLAILQKVLNVRVGWKIVDFLAMICCMLKLQIAWWGKLSLRLSGSYMHLSRLHVCAVEGVEIIKKRTPAAVPLTELLWHHLPIGQCTQGHSCTPCLMELGEQQLPGRRADAVTRCIVSSVCSDSCRTTWEVQRSFCEGLQRCMWQNLLSWVHFHTWQTSVAARFKGSDIIAPLGI